MVFGHPEHPFSYNLLTKLGKIEPLLGYTKTGVPGGKFLTAKDLYARAYPFNKKQLKAYNGILNRNYLWNFKDRAPATFVFGSSKIESVRPLTMEDVFQKGILIVGIADKFPDAKIELILPTTEPVGRTDQHYQVGEMLEIGKSSMAAVVLNAAKQGEDDPIVFRAVPLITKSADQSNLPFKTPSGQTLILETPQWLNIQ